MMGTMHIFSVADKHTTAHYFKKAVARCYGEEPVYWDTVPDLNALGPKDILFIVDPVSDWPVGLEQLPCLTIGYLIDVHQDIQSRLLLSQFFDATFVAQKDYVGAFHNSGHNHAYWLPLACDQEIHYQPSVDRIYQVGFVGKLSKVGTVRHNVLTAVLPRYHVNDYTLFYTPDEMARIYGQSDIVFNVSVNSDLNMRVFEALASGALLITDRIENGLRELFEENVHYIGYSSVDEAIEKIDYYLAHPYERQRIAAEGQRAVLASHTYDHRLNELMQRSEGLAGHASVRTYNNARLGRLYSEIFSMLRRPGRIPSVMLHYGPNLNAVNHLIRSVCRWVNVRIPMTPNAIKARLNR